MKRANFPERRNQNRKGVLERLLAKWGDNPPRWAASEINTLQRRIVDSARYVRTKKRRAE